MLGLPSVTFSGHHISKPQGWELNTFFTKRKIHEFLTFDMQNLAQNFQKIK